MRYTYREGIVRQRSWKWVAVPIVGALCVLYVLANYYAPAIFYVIEPADATAKKLVASQPKQNDDRVYIPKINTEVPIVPVQGDEPAALSRGAINREPNSGDPATGGNFVVTAHRLRLGFTPWQTDAQSPFYHLGKLAKDDDIYVDYKGVRYAYKITELRTVGDDVAGIEKRSDEKRLTLYASDITTSKDRDVIIAKQTGKIVWTNGQPRLQVID